MIRVATFNTEWRKAGSIDAELIRQRVKGADIICLTEAYRDFLGAEGYLREAPYEGPLSEAGRRKVLLWSKRPWTEVDLGEDALRGYYLGATTETADGPVRVYGMVIPYRFSGVRYGRPKRKVWELHRAFLRALNTRLPREPERAIALGDFNQRVPRKYQPAYVFEQLEHVILSRFRLATGGIMPGIEEQAIDHICLSHDLTLEGVEVLSNVAPDGHLISDHFGLGALLS